MNKVMILGNIGKIELRTAERSVLNLSIATTESYKNAQGEQVSNTEWHNCVAFGKTAEIIGKFFQKGKKIFVEGKLKTSKYEKDGEIKYSTQIIVDTFHFCESRGSGGESNNDGESEWKAPKNEPRPKAQLDLDDDDDGQG